MKLISVALFLLAAILCACGTNDSTSANKQFTYLFRQSIDGQPCSTGRKTAKNLEEFCAMLADDDENRDKKTGVVCAQSLREARLRTQCPDVQRSEIPTTKSSDFTPPPDQN
jgi:hypothetical protein